MIDTFERLRLIKNRYLIRSCASHPISAGNRGQALKDQIGQAGGVGSDCRCARRGAQETILPKLCAFYCKSITGRHPD
jgi:hypothetical protein